MSRRSAVRRVGLVVLVANLLLVAAKGAVWYATGSLAVQSEAINSLADTAYSLVVLGGLVLTTRPPDRHHPHGHERIEPFVALVVAASVFAAGGLVLWQAGTALLGDDPVPQVGAVGVGVLVASAAVKYGLYRYALRVGRREHSPALVATGLDNRNDILTAGAAVIGVLGTRIGVPALDPIAAGVVALGILYTGVEIARDNVNYLVGRAPDEELRAAIVRRALEHPDVEGAHDVIAHYVGPEVDVSLHIEVEGDRTLLEAHDIETAVAESIRELPAVDDVFVHIDPRELGEWKDDRTTEAVADDDRK